MTMTEVKLWCLPRAYLENSLMQAHQNPLARHVGIKDTLEELKKYSYWPSIMWIPNVICYI